MALEMIANIDQSSDKNEWNHYIYIFDDTSRLYKPTIQADCTSRLADIKTKEFPF